MEGRGLEEWLASLERDGFTGDDILGGENITSENRITLYDCFGVEYC